MHSGWYWPVDRAAGVTSCREAVTLFPEWVSKAELWALLSSIIEPASLPYHLTLKETEKCPFSGGWGRSWVGTSSSAQALSGIPCWGKVHQFHLSSNQLQALWEHFLCFHCGLTTFLSPAFPDSRKFLTWYEVEAEKSLRKITHGSKNFYWNLFNYNSFLFSFEEYIKKH